MQQLQERRQQAEQERVGLQIVVQAAPHIEHDEVCALPCLALKPSSHNIVQLLTLPAENLMYCLQNMMQRQKLPATEFAS